jgi:transposase InsO family protein
MDLKIEFINEWKSGKYTFNSLCGAYGIARSLGYRIRDRYQEEGLENLFPRSKAPHTQANQAPTEIKTALCELRVQYPRLGADKLLTLLQADFDTGDLPAVSTAHLILKRAGLMKLRKRFRRVEPVRPIFDPKLPNEDWSADWKGKFRMGNGLYCYPLTIADSNSRFVFMAKGVLNPTFEACKQGYEEAFKEYGMPLQLHTDNGPPFGCVKSNQRLPRLATWLLELGIEPVYSDPGHPEQNGRHERMHRELKRGGDASTGLKPPGTAAQVECLRTVLQRDKAPFNPGQGAAGQGPHRLTPVLVLPGEDKRMGLSLSEKWVGLEPVDEGIWRVYSGRKCWVIWTRRSCAFKTI